jgi:DNA-binding response OmpR family regulator
VAAPTPPLLPAPAAAVPQVLLIEDDEASSPSGARAVQGDERSSSGGYAQRAARAWRPSPAAPFDALVILDLTLPDMSGFDWLERSRGRSDRQPPPVVVYSARDLDDGELLRLHAHADAVISKGRLNGEASSRACARKSCSRSPAPAPATRGARRRTGGGEGAARTRC